MTTWRVFQSDREMCVCVRAVLGRHFVDQIVGGANVSVLCLIVADFHARSLRMTQIRRKVNLTKF